MDLQNSKIKRRILSSNFLKSQLDTTFYKLYENSDKVQLYSAKYQTRCNRYLMEEVQISLQARSISSVISLTYSDQVLRLHYSTNMIDHQIELQELVYSFYPPMLCLIVYDQTYFQVQMIRFFQELMIYFILIDH